MVHHFFKTQHTHHHYLIRRPKDELHATIILSTFALIVFDSIFSDFNSTNLDFPWYFSHNRSRRFEVSFIFSRAYLNGRAFKQRRRVGSETTRCQSLVVWKKKNKLHGWVYLLPYKTWSLVKAFHWTYGIVESYRKRFDIVIANKILPYSRKK